MNHSNKYKRRNIKAITGLSMISLAACSFFGTYHLNNGVAIANTIKNHGINNKLSSNKGPSRGEILTETFPINSRGYVHISGPEIDLVLKNAPVKEVLITLTKIGGYGLVFVPSDETAEGKDPFAKEISVNFIDEPYQRALNGVLLAAGLQGKKDKRILLVGKSVLNKNFTPQISKIYRLNQVSAASAADYLASLGAFITKVDVRTPVFPGLVSASGLTQTSDNDTKVQSYGATQGPLKGLIGTTDTRLQTITLVGEEYLVSVAEKYLKQIDLRQKQVALEVKIVDILNTDNFIWGNNFEWRMGNTYIISDDGVSDIVSAKTEALKNNTISSLGDITNVPTNSFLAWFQSQLTIGNAKILATPTMILSENSEELIGGALASLTADSQLTTSSIGRPYANESFVTIGTKSIINYTVTPGENGAAPSCEAEFGIAGLTFGAKVHNIDDNGYVSFSISPEISAVTNTIDTGTCGNVDVLSVRRLDTGNVRVKNNNTLLLTGVLKDEDIQAIKKWPILGDLPILGFAFRRSNSKKIQSELIIMVTPRIIADDQNDQLPNLNNQKNIAI